MGKEGAKANHSACVVCTSERKEDPGLDEFGLKNIMHP